LGEVNASLILEQVLTKNYFIMKHRVQLLVKNPKRFGYLGLSDYKDSKGRWVRFFDINGDHVGKFELTNPTAEFDYADEYEKTVVDFLRNHPKAGKSYFLHDLKVKEEAEVEQLLSSADAILVASKMGIAETNDFARLCGIPLDADQDVIKARLIKMASVNPDKFMELYYNPEKDDLIFLRKALDKGLIKRENGAYKQNHITMGLTEEAAIVWLKENSDVYALLKQELRGNVTVKVQSSKQNSKTKSEKIEE